MSRKPRVWPPFPYTVSGKPKAPWMMMRFSAEDAVVVRAVHPGGVKARLRGIDTVHHALVQARDLHAPRDGPPRGTRSRP